MFQKNKFWVVALLILVAAPLSGQSTNPLNQANIQAYADSTYDLKSTKDKKMTPEEAALALQRVDLNLTNRGNYLDSLFFLVVGNIEYAFKRITSVTWSLAGLLATIDLIIMWFMIGIGASDLRSELIQRLIFFSVWSSLLLGWPVIADFARDLFIYIGIIAGGAQEDVKFDGPSNVILSAFKLANPVSAMMTHALGIDPRDPTGNTHIDTGWPLGFPNLVDWIIGFAVYVTLMYIFMKIAVEYFITYIKTSVVFAFGGFFIPFAIFKPTRNIFESYIGSCFAHLAQLMLFMFSISLGNTLIAGVTFNFTNSAIQLQDLVSIIMVALIYLALTVVIPPVAMDIISGGASISDINAISSAVQKGAAVGASAAIGMSQVSGGAIGGAVGGAVRSAPAVAAAAKAGFMGGGGWGGVAAAVGAAVSVGGSSAVLGGFMGGGSAAAKVGSQVGNAIMSRLTGGLSQRGEEKKANAEKSGIQSKGGEGDSQGKAGNLPKGGDSAPSGSPASDGKRGKDNLGMGAFGHAMNFIGNKLGDKAVVGAVIGSVANGFNAGSAVARNIHSTGAKFGVDLAHKGFGGALQKISERVVANPIKKAVGSFMDEMRGSKIGNKVENQLMIPKMNSNTELTKFKKDGGK